MTFVVEYVRIKWTYTRGVMMINNQYIAYIKNYIYNNTPVDFIYCEDKYCEIKKAMEKENIIVNKPELIYACYTLFYSSLSYHNEAEKQTDKQPYYILLGDYISSYVAELLYKNKLYNILKVFSASTKQLMLNIMNHNEEDPLLNNIISTLKNG